MMSRYSPLTEPPSYPVRLAGDPIGYRHPLMFDAELGRVVRVTARKIRVRLWHHDHWEEKTVACSNVFNLQAAQLARLEDLELEHPPIQKENQDVERT